jgi:HPt (histidine-containing phosphotransfer) domain-containing protein
MIYNRFLIEGKNMNQADPLIEERVVRQLLADIGLENTRKFIDSLDSEINKRIQNMTKAINEKNFEDLAAQAHSLKSSAQVSGTFPLAENMVGIESAAGLKNHKVFDLAKEALILVELTRFAYLDIKLHD